MEILTYKSLNEINNSPATQKFKTTAALDRLSGELAGKTGISTAEMQALAQTMQGVDMNLENTNIANEFRNVGFLFLKNEPNLYVRLAPIVGGIRNGRMPEEFNQIGSSFVTIFSKDNSTCYFFPYTKNAPKQVYLESNERLLGYFSLKIYSKKIDRRTGVYFPYEQVDIRQYFNNFNPKRRIKDNIFFYELKKGNKFDEINNLYKIDDASLLSLPNYAFGGVNTDFLIHFGNVSKPFKLQKGEKSYSENKIVKPSIVFNIPSNLGLKTTLDNLFSGRIQYNHFETITNAFIRSVNFTRPYYMSRFQSNTGTIIIYTQNKIQPSTTPIDCFISYRQRIVGGKITVNRI